MTEHASTSESQAEVARLLERQRNDQRAFSYGISHELRAPLRVIVGFAGQLRRRTQGVLDAESADMLERIEDNARRMSGLLDGLLDLSRVGTLPLQPETVDLTLLADWVGAELIDLHPGRAARIEVQPDLSVWGDARKLRVLLTRLMENAWAFTPADQPVHIAVTGTRVGDRLQLCVRDRGRGLDPQYIDQLFEPFHRVHTQEEGAGSGLGLAVAMRIVERHGGRIHAESAGEGQGTTLCFDLPAQAPQGEQPDVQAPLSD